MMRPDDLHTAMRADLVVILKDVVGLIARIEATLPSPQPVYPQLAHSPGVQNEGSGRHGDDQRAQKEGPLHTAPSAGAAEAGLHNADRRNSSRPAGEGSSAPFPVNRTPVSKQPTDAALPPSVEKAEPPAASSPPPAPQEAPTPILIPKAQAKPKPASKPLDPRPGRAIGVVKTHEGSVVSVDVINSVVICPKGDWETSRPVAAIMERMRDGETFGDNVLAEIGSMGEDSFRESRKRWAEDLAKRGVTFIHTKGVGCRIEVAR